MRDSGRLAVAAMILAFVVDVVYLSGASYEAVAYPGGIAFGLWVAGMFLWIRDPETLL